MAIAAIFAASLLIGLVMGLFGGGGGVLTVPFLVYMVGVEPKEAIVTSLLVVGITSIIAVLQHFRSGVVCWKIGAVFGLAGIAGAYSGGRLAAWMPGKLLLVLFAAVMLAASAAMLRGNGGRRPKSGERSPCQMDLPVLAIVFDGFMIGLLTGLVGVGGGFLLVPALAFLAGLPMHSAIGTSLLIITLLSAAGLAGHAAHMSVDVELTAWVAGGAVTGSFLGAFLSHRLSGRVLKRGFGIFVLALGGGMLYRETDAELVRQVHAFVDAHRQFLLGAGSMLLILLLYRLWHWLHAKSENL